MVLVVAAVAVLSVLHLAIGSVSVCVGVALSAKAEVWLAHTVSPIWSGCFVSFHCLILTLDLSIIELF